MFCVRKWNLIELLSQNPTTKPKELRPGSGKRHHELLSGPGERFAKSALFKCKKYQRNQIYCVHLRGFVLILYIYMLNANVSLYGSRSDDSVGGQMGVGRLRGASVKRVTITQTWVFQDVNIFNREIIFVINLLVKK